MTALSAERETTSRAGEVYAFPVKANVKIWKGSLVVLDAGYAKPGAAGTGLIAVGRAESTVDNTGGIDGALTVEVQPGLFKWANSAAADLISQAEVGTQCYVVDDQTVAKTDGSATRSEAGSIVQVESDGVWVKTRFDISLRGVDIAALQTSLAAAEGDIDDLEALTLGDRMTAAEGAVSDLETVTGRRQVRTIGALAASANLHAAYAGGSGAIADAAGPWSAIPLPARQVQIVCSATCAVGVATVEGTDEAGAAVSENLATGNGVTSKGTKAFATITGFSTDVDPGGGETVTLQTGPGFGLGGPVSGIHAVSADGVREAVVFSDPAVGLVEPTTAPDGSVVFAAQVTP